MSPGSAEDPRANARRATALLDLTTLADDDTKERVRALCARARDPLGDGSVRVAAVCVYPRFIDTAREALDGSGVPVCAVAGDFPTAQAPVEQRVAEASAAHDAGADEIDVVIQVQHVLQGAWEALEDEVRAYRGACGKRLMKVILRTGELQTLGNVARASTVAMTAGADFIKTSTGKEAVNATLPVGVVMARAIRSYEGESGRAVGLKPAGGISTYEAAAEWMQMVETELGEAWIRPERLRFGASSLLADLRRVVDAR